MLLNRLKLVKDKDGSTARKYASLASEKSLSSEEGEIDATERAGRTVIRRIDSFHSFVTVLSLPQIFCAIFQASKPSLLLLSRSSRVMRWTENMCKFHFDGHDHLL